MLLCQYFLSVSNTKCSYYAEPPVRFVRPRKMASRLEKAAGESLVLDCEVSRSNAEVIWKKNGEDIEDTRNITILEDGVMRHLTIHSLSMEDAGQYVCDAKDDVMDFHVTVKGRLSYYISQVIKNIHFKVPQRLSKTTFSTLSSFPIIFLYVFTRLFCFIANINVLLFCSFSELPVKILGKPQAKTEKQFFVSDDIILVCELSRSNVPVSWYKDNQLIDNTDRYCCEEQGVFQSLVVINAGLEDSGEYTCDVVDDKMIFYITVKGNHIIKQFKYCPSFQHSGNR